MSEEKRNNFRKVIIQLAAEMKANNDEIPPDSVSLWVEIFMRLYQLTVAFLFNCILSFNCCLCIVGLHNGY